jgi:hypothetical protein
MEIMVSVLPFLVGARNPLAILGEIAPRVSDDTIPPV